MKKILLLFLSVLTFISCTNTYRNDDFFIIISKKWDISETGYTSYKYLYCVRHYMISEKKGSFILGDDYFRSNENYELGDTIKFIRCTSNKK